MGHPHRMNTTTAAMLLAVALLASACGSGSKQEAPASSPAAGSPAGSPAAPVTPTEKIAVKMPKQSFNANGNAADGILALESQGYNVVVQNGGGDPGHRNPLSQCRIASVDGLRGDTPPANTTVYLTVAC